MVYNCYQSYNLTSDETTLGFKDNTYIQKIQQAYDLCNYNHQAQAYRIAYILKDKAEITDAFNKVDKTRFKTNNLADLNSAQRMYNQRIIFEEDPYVKVGLMEEGINFSGDSCDERIKIINMYIVLNKYSKAKDILNFYKETPYTNKYSYTCLDIDFGKYPGSPNLDKEDYFNYLLAEYRVERMQKKLSEITDLYNQMKELVKGSIFNKINFDKLNEENKNYE